MMIFEIASIKFGIPAGLLAAMCMTESNHNPAAVNPKDGAHGSHGICQIQPATARMFRPRISLKELYKPEINVEVAAQYLAHQYKRYKSWPAAVAAYNAGKVYRRADGSFVNAHHVGKVMREWDKQLVKQITERIGYLDQSSRYAHSSTPPSKKNKSNPKSGSSTP